MPTSYGSRDVLGQDEAAHRRQHFDLVTGLERAVRPAGERAARHLLDRDTEAVLARRSAERIGAPVVDARFVGAQREMLARLEAEGFAQLGGNIEQDRHGILCLAPDLGDPQAMESLVQ